MLPAIQTPIGALPNKRALDRLRVTLAQYNRELPDVMTRVPVPGKGRAFTLTDSALMNRPQRAWRSSRFIACLYVEPGKLGRRLSVCRARLNDHGAYEDQLTWDELQQIKRECGFGDCDAIELYPRDDDVVNVANMRHLWILDDLSPLTWRDGTAAKDDDSPTR